MVFSSSLLHKFCLEHVRTMRLTDDFRHHQHIYEIYFQQKNNQRPRAIIWVSINSTGKVFNGCIRDLEFNRTPNVKLSPKKKKKKKYEDQELLKRTINYVYVLFVYYNIYK